MTEYRYQYNNDDEKAAIKAAHADLTLIKVEEITEGKFLTFVDTPPLENQLQDIKNNTDMILLKGEGII